MELNTSETHISFRSVFQEEDPRIVAKSYLVYKIGELNKHVAKTKMIYIYWMALNIFPRYRNMK